MARPPGEHRTSLPRVGYLLKDLLKGTGAGAVNTMRGIQRVLDPANIMNLGRGFGL